MSIYILEVKEQILICKFELIPFEIFKSENLWQLITTLWFSTSIMEIPFTTISFVEKSKFMIQILVF